MGLRWCNFGAGLQADLMDSLRRNVESFNAQDIANSLLALDQMGLKWVNFPDGLQDKLMESVRRNVGKFNAQGIANTLLALDQIGLRWRNFDPGLQADLKNSVRGMLKVNAQDIANSLLALDQMGLRWRNFGAGLQADLMNSVSNNVKHFNAQNIANSLLALSRLRINNDEILELLINQVRGLDSFLPIEVSQILLSLTWIKAYQGKAFIDLEGRFDPVNEITDSRLHQDVIRSIKEMQLSLLKKEKRMGVKGVIIVDCYIPDINLVIEVHGPLHYSLDGSLNVKSEKQAELIKKLGFQYQVISYKDWDELKDDAAKKAFIKNLMPSQLNAGASVFRPRKNLDPSVVASKPIYRYKESCLCSIVLNSFVLFSQKVNYYENTILSINHSEPTVITTTCGLTSQKVLIRR